MDMIAQCVSTMQACVWTTSLIVAHIFSLELKILRVSALCNIKYSDTARYLPGGYSSMIWVGMCRWDLKSRPILFLYQILSKNETHFYTRATNSKQNLLKMSHYFPKLLSFQANFGNFGIRLMKLGLFSCQFKKILKIWPMFVPVLALNKGTLLYQEADLRPISAARPRIDLCTKNPPGYLASIFTVG